MLKKCIARWDQLLSRFVQSRAEQAVLLGALGSLCTASESFADVYEHSLHALYESDAEVLSEAAVLEWADAAEQAADGSDEKRLLKLADKFVTWLREADEEESGSDDDDDDDE